MKKVLYIVYYYPPIGGSGVQRGLKFSKYLPEFGWESIILTPYPSLLKQAKDKSLMRDIPRTQKIYRSVTFDANWLFKLFWGLRLPQIVTWLNYHVFIPDAQILWLPFARLKIRRIMREHKIDLVFISGPPFSPMLLGKWILARYAIPYIVSFRDDWSQGQSRLDNPPPKSFQRRESKLEHEVLRQANHIVVVINSYKKDLPKLYPDILPEKISVITNGYDEADFQLEISPRKAELDKLQIVHAGALYGRRHPGKTWQALINLTRSGAIDPEKISIHLYGYNFASFVFKGFENDPIIHKLVHLHPYLPHGEMTRIILQADALWLFSGPGSRSDAVLPGKMFEYMRSGLPILAVINPRGVSAEVLEQSGLGLIANNEDVHSIEEQILQLYRKWENDDLAMHPNWDYIRSFERRALTAKLAQAFTETVSNMP